MNRAVGWSIFALVIPWLGVVASQLLIPPPLKTRDATSETAVPEKKLFGEYFFGGLGNTNLLDLKPTHRYSYTHGTCTSRDSPSYGRWEQRDGTILLFPDEEHGYPRSTHLIPVTWGERVLLIDKNQMPGFCVSLKNYGSLMNYGFHEDYTSRSKPNASPLAGKPSIPKKYQDFLDRGEITARVMGVNIDKSVVLFGKQVPRLQPGMQLCVDNHPAEREPWDKPELQILAVRGLWARARQVSVFSKYRKIILPGDTFTTGSTSDRPERTVSRF